jgi:hypothetical protein
MASADAPAESATNGSGAAANEVPIQTWKASLTQELK